MDKKDQFSRILEIRNFEIELFWRRSNYFLFLNTAIAVGYFSKVTDHGVLISIFGLVTSLIWLCVNFGSKFWQSKWEEEIARFEEENDPDRKLFSQSKSEVKDLVSDSLKRNNHGFIRRQVDKLILLKPSVSFMMILLSISFIGFWGIMLANEASLFSYIQSFSKFEVINTTTSSVMNSPENYYWFFSASAQSISAFIAVLLTGFAIVLTIMSSIENQDETLDEIIERLKHKYFWGMLFVSIITAFAICMSLIMVFYNNITYEYKGPLIYITASLNILSIIVGLSYMLYIIYPKRYSKIAQEILKDEEKKVTLTGHTVNKLQFLNKFIELEKEIRNFVENNNELFVEESFRSNSPRSVRFMIKALVNSGVINKEIHNRLLQLNRVRNAVVHGEEDKIDEKFVDLADDLLNEIRNMGE